MNRKRTLSGGSSRSDSFSERSSSPENRKKVSIVTPERGLSVREKRKEAKLVRLLTSRRDRHSDESDTGYSPVKRRLNFDPTPEYQMLLSIEAEPEFLSFMPSHMQYGLSEKTYFGSDFCFLKIVLGDCQAGLDRFEKWSKWNSDTINVKIEKNAPVSEYVRSVMWCLVRADKESLKRMVLLSDRQALLRALQRPFGKLKRTLLHAVAMHALADELVEILRFLPSIEPSVSAVSDKFGLAPLHYLCLNSNLESANTLSQLSRIGGGHPTISVPSMGALAVHMLLLSRHDPEKMNDSQYFQALAFLGPHPSVRAFSEQRTPLMTAITSGSLRAVETLLALSDGAKCMDRDGQTCVFIACATGRADICDLVLTRTPERLKMQRCNAQGSSPMHAAAAGGSPGHAACIAVLVEKISSNEIAANLKDDNKWPPLMYALFAGQEATIKACIAADREIEDPAWGRFPQFLFTLQVCARDQKLTKLLLPKLFSVPECFDYINEFLSGDISRLAGPLSVMLETPLGTRMLSIENKLKFLQYRCLDHTRTTGLKACIDILVACEPSSDRDWLLNLYSTKANHKQGQQIACTFANLPADGVSYTGGSGPTREFFSIASRIICESLFVSNSENTQMLPSNNPGDKDLCETAGWIVGASLISNSTMNLSKISNLLWRFLLEGDIGYKPDVADLFSWDAQVSRSLQYILNCEALDENTEMLLEGKERAVFVSAQVGERILTCNFQHFRNGFFSAVPEDWIVDFFDANELAVVFGKNELIDTTQWKQNTKYWGYTEEDLQIKWFWEVVEELSPDERSLLLIFATGMATVPIGGFANLSSIHGDRIPFTISRVTASDWESPLPTAATCFNMLRLPVYPSKGGLRDKLLAAIRFGSAGFTFH